MLQIHFVSKGIFFFKGTAEQWKVIEADHEAVPDNWTLRPIAIGTCRHRCIARAQVRHNRPERAAHFKEHGQMAVGTKHWVNMLVHHHHLCLDEHPFDVAQSQDGSNAYNEMETVTIAEGILTAPASHHAIHGYFFQASKHATKVYVSGHSDDAGEKCHAFLFKKGCKQGSLEATDLYCYGATYMLRVMANELRQNPDDHG